MKTPITSAAQIKPYPWMSKEEIACIEAYLRPDMLLTEWGTGGGTLYFAKKVKAVHAIEHNAKWARIVREALVLNGVTNVEITLVESPVRVNPIIAGPYKDGYEEAFRHYANVGSAFPLDAAMVDGRSRLQCARAAMRVLAPGGIVFFHDYFCKHRERYWVFEQDPGVTLIDSVRTGQSLAVFRKGA